MSLTLTLELSPAAVAGLERFAAATGRTVAEQAKVTLEHAYGFALDLRSEADKQAAREQFRRHFGADSAPVRPGDHNENIDADLAREYADNHEG